MDTRFIEIEENVFIDPENNYPTVGINQVGYDVTGYDRIGNKIVYKNLTKRGANRCRNNLYNSECNRVDVIENTQFEKSVFDPEKVIIPDIEKQVRDNSQMTIAWDVINNIPDAPLSDRPITKMSDIAMQNKRANTLRKQFSRINERNAEKKQYRFMAYLKSTNTMLFGTNSDMQFYIWLANHKKTIGINNMVLYFPEALSREIENTVIQKELGCSW